MSDGISGRMDGWPRLCGRVALALVAGLALPAAAQNGAEPAADAAEEPPLVVASPDDAWTIRFEPSIWFVAPAGDLTVPGAGSSSVDVGDLNLDSPRLTPAGELTFNTDRWRLSVSGFDFSTEDRGSTANRNFRVGDVDVLDGDSVESDLRFLSWDVKVRYEIAEIPGRPLADGRWPYVMSLEAVGGVRFYDVGFDLSAPGGTASSDEFFAEPVAGLRVVLDVLERLTIDVESTIGAWTDGGDRESFSFDIAAGFMYRPIENVGVQIGYRQQMFSLSSGEGSDEFEFDGALAGVYAGVVVRF